MKIRLFLLLTVCLSIEALTAQVSARLFRYPDVSKDHITFVYGGDLWIVDKAGGTASKLSSPSGSESFPKFSPDGSKVAFSGNYDGNLDIYVVPALGGVPERMTYHGMSDRLIDWYPDGSKLLYASSRESGKQRFSQFYAVDAKGGLAEKLPMAMAEFGSMAPDGQKIAFTDRSRIFRTWKRYEGGMNADIWIFDLNTMASENITSNNHNDDLPMWHKDLIYYVSDEGPNQRYNIWKYNTVNKSKSQVTTFSAFDVHFPSIGPEEIIFEAGGELYLMDLATEELRPVEINVISDMMSIKPRKESVEDYITTMALAPDGNRAVVEARGEVFSLPAEKGYVQNLTRTPGVAERYPAWSPNGKYIAYWSDQSGEYDLYIRDMTQGSKEQKLTDLGPGYRYQLFWSPDSKKLAFVDQTMTINLFDIPTQSLKAIDQDISLFEGGLRNWQPSWSSDSQWLAYSKTQDNGNNAIIIYNVETGNLTQATSGFYSDQSPAFDPGGQYLYLVTNRSFNPVYSNFDNSWVYPNATQLAAIPLRADVPTPLPAENDTVAIEIEEDTSDSKEEVADTEEDVEKKKDDAEQKVDIDFENFERRLVVLPPESGRIRRLAGVKDKVVYLRFPNAGSADNESELKYFDLKEKEEKTIMKGVNGYLLSADGKKVLVRKGGKYAIVGVSPDQKMEKTLATAEMEMTIDPQKEWAQIFQDAWRFQRDFFYDQDMHGVDWEAMYEQYRPLIDHCINRSDVNFVIGELIGELNASHAYRGGGDNEDAKQRAVGYLGIDWEKKNGHFAIKQIVRGAEWDNEVRSPLDEPGIQAQEGDYILAVNGIALNEYPDPNAAFEGLAGKTVELTINDKPSWEDARQVVVKTMTNETRLRNLAWIESNRKKVDKASDGKIGYIYVPSTGVDGQNELARQFYGQWNKEGLIIDERFNNGGQIPDRFIELLNRKPLAYWDVRDGQNWQWPPVANFGTMAMLINGWSGSGGDAFPDYFRKSQLGPLIGGRTWGGLIGISGSPPLIDGGTVTVPTFRMYNPDGTWFAEGHGVDPDIEVLEDPTALAQGIDTQLDKAIEEVMKNIKTRGPIHPETPKKENRARKKRT